MRRSAWVLPLVAVIAWMVCIGWPAIALLERLILLPRTDVESHSLASLLMTSVLWSAAVSVGAAIVGWIPGHVLGKALAGPRSGFLPLAVLMMAPICLPSYIVFYAWWQSWPADSAFHQWVIANHAMGIARQATLYLGLVCWSWPLVSWSVAGFAAGLPAQHEDLLLLDGAGPVRRMSHRLRNDSGGLALGSLLVFLATLANTTCFDLAEVFTFANELRAMQALGANSKDVAIQALPAIALGAMGAALVWRLLGSSSGAHQTAYRVRPAGAWSAVMVSTIWTCSVVVSLGLFAWNLIAAGAVGEVKEFFTLYRWSVGNTAMYAAVSGSIAAVVSIGFAAAWMHSGRWIKRLANALAVTWIIAALVPGTLVGVALQAAYDRKTFLDVDVVHTGTPGILQSLIMLQPTVYLVAHLASFGFIAVLMARWTASREPASLRDLRRLDGADSLSGVIQANRPRLVAAAWATFAVVFVLAIGEIAVTAVVSPPHRAGAGPLALTLLNDMHYQRPQTVMMASIFFILAALGAALIVSACWFGAGRRNLSIKPQFVSRILLLCTSVALLTINGCTPDDPDNPPPLNAQLVFGRAGTALGQFAYPRAIDVDPQRERLYVIDKQARVQRFSFDGKPQAQWQMPDSENGKPTGVSVAPDGRIFVADTHYFRVIVYDPDGHELLRFGEFGRGPGQFIYVTDVAFGPDGHLYVSEYGGNDRVQVFDQTGRYLFEFATFGEHGKLSRPQSLAFDAEGKRLYIADACNHRIVVVDAQGEWLGEFGSAGRGFGQLTYPYGLTLLRDGSILVAEFGNNRLQRFSAEGKPLGIYGSIGRAQGQLQYPWGVAATADRVFVLDSGNNRVQVIRNF